MNELIQVQKLAFLVGAATLAAPVTLVAGSNITLTPSGNSLTIASAGGGGISYPLLAPDGSAGAPSYSFTNAPTTGLYIPGNDSLLVSIAGILLADFNNGGLEIIGAGTQLLVDNGSMAAPPYTFAGQSSTGMYTSGSDVRFTGGGNDLAVFDTGGGASETFMLLWDVDTNALQRVSVGAADSGGTGFKVLRIPN